MNFSTVFYLRLHLSVSLYILPLNQKLNWWCSLLRQGNFYYINNKNGTTVLPNGRLLNLQEEVYVAPHPFRLISLSGDGARCCYCQFRCLPASIQLTRNLTTSPEIIQGTPGSSSNTGVLNLFLWVWQYHPIKEGYMLLRVRINQYFLLSICLRK